MLVQKICKTQEIIKKHFAHFIVTKSFMLRNYSHII